MMPNEAAANPVVSRLTRVRTAQPSAPLSTDPPRLLPRQGDNPWLRRALVFATCVLLADAIFGERGLAETLRAQRDYAQAEAQLRLLRYENAALREEARQLRSDPGAIEAVAREQLGLLRPGEILIVVKDLPR
jgi:cell division protein FtsB